MNINSITASELLALRNEGASAGLIDLRTPVEFREDHAQGARVIPLDRLDPQGVMSGRNGMAQAKPTEDCNGRGMKAYDGKTSVAARHGEQL